MPHGEEEACGNGLPTTMDGLLDDTPDGPVNMIGSDDEADFVVRKVLFLQKEKARLMEIASRQIQQIEMKRKGIADEYDNKIEWQKSRLETFFEDKPKAVTKTQQSYRLFSGKLIRKARQPEFVRDEKTIITWLVDHNMTEYAVAEWHVKWDSFKRRLSVQGEGAIDAETGEVVDGIRVFERPPEFVIREE